MQPWRIVFLNGLAQSEFVDAMSKRLQEGGADQPEYEIYPQSLSEPYRTSRYSVGEQMYAVLGIGREDKAKRFQWLARNFAFFGAPASLFCFIDRRMGPPQ